MEFVAATASDDTKVVSSVSAKRNPSDFLKQVIGKPVVVQLSSGVTYRGVLACLDGFMNIAMEQTEEYVDGQLKARYGDCFIRGNNGNICVENNKYNYGLMLSKQFIRLISSPSTIIF
jgi:U6 snRNA-associated Sm-like protein LSm6